MKAVLVYDGSCGVCDASTRLILRLDWLRLIIAVPLQSEALYRSLPGLDREACRRAMHLVLPGGRIRSGGDAVRAVLARLPLSAPIAFVLAVPPLPAVLRACYPWIAARRRALSATCRLRPR